MKSIVLLIISMSFFTAVFSQNTFTAIVKDHKTGEPLRGVTVMFKNIKQTALTDSNGLVTIADIASGPYLIEYSYTGYIAKTDTVTLPHETFVVRLEPDEAELEEVIVSSTRSSRTIASIPTRIEVIAGEELDEKANMKPGDIRMVLNESTGIQTQQTSATSANASIRIQGLDGRYTQILKDGFPLFSGAASGLGLLQIPPLDLQQVEVIKGSASTLYGGGAIAGLVNLISKTPDVERELNFHLNGTSAGGADVNGFYGQRFGKAGLTLFASRNSNKPYDPSGTGLTAIPKFERYTVNPKLFLYFNDRTQLNFGVNTSFESRTGGDINYIRGDDDRAGMYFERNKTSRLSSQFSIEHQLTGESELSLRNSVSYFNRKVNTPVYEFEGAQYATYTEGTYKKKGEFVEWISGLSIWTDNFEEERRTGVFLRDYNQTTAGAFIQNNLRAAKWLDLEMGLRGDYVSDYGFVFLPRLSAFFKLSNSVNSRLGGGLGYKTPTIFTEESERIQYQDILPVNSQFNTLEKSYGFNWDINYRTPLFNDAVSFSINHLFFYTFLNHPLLLNSFGSDGFRFENHPGHIDSKGLETNIKVVWGDVKLFSGYTLTDTRLHSGSTFSVSPLTARHRLNNVLMYELEEQWKLGAEAYYYGTQKLNDGSNGRPYWIFGFMAEKLWDKFSVYINFENFTDTRQTRFDNIYSGSISNPVFRDIYAPLDGFVINGGLKLRL